MTQQAPQLPASEMDGEEQQAGGDIQAQIKEGLTAFMQSQDPAIAVEVCKMLAQEMGIGSDAPPEGGSAEPASSEGSLLQSGVLQGKNGMRFFKKGGKLRYKRAY